MVPLLVIMTDMDVGNVVFAGVYQMNSFEQQRFNELYQQHLLNLRLQVKRPATIDAYSRAVRRITEYFDHVPDTLTTQDLKKYFDSLIQTHSWSTIKLDRNGLQFFYRYTLDKQWEWLNIIKPPQVKRLPDILTPQQVGLVISGTKNSAIRPFSDYLLHGVATQ